MKTASILLLLNDNTKKLYAFTVTINRHQGAEQEKNGISRPTPYYVIAGAVCQWTYFLVVSLTA
jgi:hypothetical protein